MLLIAAETGRRAAGPWAPTLVGHVGTMLFHVALIMLCLFAMGLYQRRYMRGRALIQNITIAAGMSLVLWLVLDNLIMGNRTSFVRISAAHFGLFALMGLTRPIVCFYCRNFASKRRLALVGSPALAQHVQQITDSITPSEFVVVAHHPMDCAAGRDEMPKMLQSLRDSAEYDEIYVEMGSADLDLLVEKLPGCKLGRISPQTAPSIALFERYGRWIEQETGGPPALPSLSGTNYRFFWVKRVLETLIAGFGVLLVLPVIVLTMIAIKLDDGGSVFYRQTRVGKNGRHFSVLKFRSMIENAETDGARWASVGDCRVTRIGEFLRKSRIDEIPQLFNVLKGDMALVGPRPERPEFVEQLARDIPGYEGRHVVRPGLTGWAQISYSYGSSLEDARWKTRFDFYYIKNWTIWLDLAIVAQTVRVVLLAEGSR
ncbi:exopolysaccharide biosynthesis polyprenyl glycosylphosphotransferase [Roseovarius spongiae]|uniref:Exopolysaccharide biosynthesis polyprenyl glycosylphosphotransferase n=1 Tax=Roseovarius spongiae TaxID=2320272 RepID=A0A3A8AT79_9RHOB|nr:exopolysaccharide biosynthesis polyprenyl glycosylphosphotransferase [Roseovarius spongiae]